jgi:hypothetical protein
MGMNGSSSGRRLSFRDATAMHTIQVALEPQGIVLSSPYLQCAQQMGDLLIFPDSCMFVATLLVF